jgi:hypothetical protein
MSTDNTTGRLAQRRLTAWSPGAVTAPAPQQVVAGNLGQLSLPCLVIAAAGANKVAVLLGNSDDSFQPPVYYNVGAFPESVALGDVNGDGNLDIIAANYDSSTISVLLGNSDRTFQAQQTYGTSPNPESIVIADFNSDGKVDVATVNSGTNPGKVNVLLNVNGTFPNAVTSDVGVAPFSLAVGDFNGDGKVDLVTANHSGGVSVLLNNGVRPFPAVAPAPVGAGSAPYSVAVADFNLDGQADIAVSNGDNGGSVGILPNSGGSFQALQAANTFATGPNPFFIAVGDFNVDGKPDIVTPNHPNPVVNPGTISVLLNSAQPFANPPANDNFSAAQTLTSAVSGRVTGTTIGATHEASEPTHAGRTGTGSVWYNWTAPASGGATFDTFASTFDTALAVYTGPGYGSLTEISSGDNDRGANGELRGTSRVKFSAIAGTTYRIGVDSGGFATASGNVTLNWSLLPPPANDNFANAQVITGSTGTASSTNAGATKQSGEPDHAGNPGGASIWYRWTAPSTGSFTFNTSSSVLNGGFGVGGSSYDTLLAVYTGSSLPEVSQPQNLVASNDDAVGSLTSQVTFNASQGTTYQIAVDSKGNAKSDVALSWSVTPVGTPHDSFANALLISGDSGSAGSAIGSNGEAWFRWSPTSNGAFSFTSPPFSLSSGLGQSASIISAYVADSQNNLTPTGVSSTGACRFGQPQCDSSTVRFDASPSTTYAIRITRSSGASGGASVSWGSSPPPTNDNLANAAVIGGFSGGFGISNGGATSEPGEPAHAGFPAVNSIWFAWTAPGTFNVRFSGGTFFSTGLGEYGVARIGVYTGSSYSSPLTTIAGSFPSVTFDAVQGTTYRIAVDYGGATGVTFGGWAPTGAPANDSFINAQTLNGSSGSVLGTNKNATKESGEPNHAGNAGGASVWYNWTPSVSGPITFNTDRSPDTLLSIYTGSAVNNLSNVVANDDENVNPAVTTSRVTFNAIAGTTYRIAVDGKSSATGGITLSWGTPRNIAGRLTDIRGAGVANVVVTLSGDASRKRISDSQGNYSFPDLVQGGSYTITPDTSLYNFDLTSRTYNPLSSDVTNANFVAKTPTYFITGRLTANGAGLGNIVVNLAGTDIQPGTSVPTTSDGKYTFSNLTTNGDFTVTPSSSSYTFNATIFPSDHSYTFNTLNQPVNNADFTGVAAAPSNLSYSNNPAVYTKGVAITSNLPSSSGGPVATYSINPLLPAGLSFNTTTGVISGTPSVLSTATNYTVTATNSGGSAMTNVNIRVNDVAPSNLTYSNNPAAYTKGVAITSNTPSSSGGAVVSYSINPSLPTGLNLSTTTGVISGTPSVLSETASYT